MDDGEMRKKRRGRYAMVRGEKGGGGREKRRKVRGGERRMKR